MLAVDEDSFKKIFWQAPAVSDDVVDVAEEEKEEAPIVTVAHTVEAIPSPPRSPFRFVPIIAEAINQSPS